MDATNDHLNRVAKDPNLLLHRYDETHDSYQFLNVDRQVHRQCTFLTDEHLPKDLEKIALRRSEALRVLPKPARMHFIFHSAYCCSTMLARAFDIKGVSMGFKEPVVLNDMVGWKRRGGEPRKIAEVLDQSMHWLSKPFSSGEAIIIKPSNIVNTLALAMLAMRPDAKAVLLHAPLKDYLGSIAKKDLWGRLWVRKLFVGQIQDQMIAPFGMTGDDMLQLSDLQVAAVGWLAQHALFSALIQKYGSQRVRSLNSKTFLSHQYETMQGLIDLFQLNVDQTGVRDIVEGPAFKRHSKIDVAFDSASREKEHADAASLHADEIEKVSEWARVMGERMNIPMTLEASLI